MRADFEKSKAIFSRKEEAASARANHKWNMTLIALSFPPTTCRATLLVPRCIFEDSYFS